MRLPHDFYRRDARLVARELLGHRLVTFVDGVRTAGRIIETEAYLGADDPASHSHRGPTARNAPMFLAGGFAYVYLIYGMYWCFNVVTGEEGEGEAVLIRAIEPLEGIDVMRARRGAARDLANGPGKLVIALGITREMNAADLASDRRVWIEEGVAVTDAHVRTTPRIGISRALEHHWRYVAVGEITQRRNDAT
jgi:DNA-3-methyladenine glycosylase